MSPSYSLAIRASISALIIGTLFTIMIWPYAPILTSAGTLGIAIFYTLRFIYKPIKDKLVLGKLGLVLLWAFQALLKIWHLPFDRMAGFIFWGYAIVFLAIVYFQKNGEWRRILNMALFQTHFLWKIGAGLTCVAVLFKVQHWPFTADLFILGMSILAVGILLPKSVGPKAAK